MGKEKVNKWISASLQDIRQCRWANIFISGLEGGCGKLTIFFFLMFYFIGS